MLIVTPRRMEIQLRVLRPARTASLDSVVLVRGSRLPQARRPKSVCPNKVDVTPMQAAPIGYAMSFWVVKTD